MKLEIIQDSLRRLGIQAWLLYDFKEQDQLALQILDLSPKKFRTRRWFYLVPKEGDPVKLVHRIEHEALDNLPGEKLLYSGQTELEEMLRKILRPFGEVAMQYSPRSAVPYISRVDAGTIELVKSCGPLVISSGDLIQILEATWNSRQLESHKKTAQFLLSCVRKAFKQVSTSIKKNERLTELSLQQFLLDEFKKNRYVTDHSPIVAVNAHTGNPHYSPTKESSSDIQENSLILLDLWCKKNEKDAPYADITWVAYAGKEVPAKIQEIFSIVRDARDKAIDFVRGRVLAAHPIMGYEVDEKVRRFIAGKGYGENFTHRTGHSIGQEVHWVGANIDNFETIEQRRIIPKTCFSVEPGIYLRDFGVRSEVDVYVDDLHVEVNPPELQEEVVLIHPGS